MFKEVMSGLDRINPSVDQFESGGGTSLPGSTRSAGTTDFRCSWNSFTWDWGQA